MESSAIVAALEAAHPTPSLRLDHPLQEPVQKLVYKVLKPLLPELLPLYPKHVLSEGSMEYWVRTRSEAFGDLDTWHAEKGGEQCWEAAQEGLQEGAQLLEKEGGPFVAGLEPCYADFVWVAFVQFVRRAGEECFERVVRYDEIRRQYEACQKWMERDD
jgi:glutathione S-transferase